MRIAKSEDLIAALKQLGLLTREQLGQSWRLVSDGTAKSLAKVLVQRGWLTVYQMNQLLAGAVTDLVFGPYQVLDQLGQGGLSQVFQARHSEYGWIVALKVLKTEALANDEGRLQFLHEMEAMARLDHPNIVQFCDVDATGDTFYYAMEFVAGTDLGKYLRLSGALPVAEACDYIRQTSLGLQHAHERNLVHRDIKPVNLFLTHPPGCKLPLLKILDWGLASLRCPMNLNDNKPAAHLSKGLLGTADYISPEQARSAHNVDIRSDIYSLGCTFYFLLTGQPPFPDGTLMQKLYRHQTAEPEPIDAFREDVPSGVTAILRRMLAKQADERFQTPAAVALQLLPFANDFGKTIAKRPPTLKRGKNSPRKDDTPLPIALGGKVKSAARGQKQNSKRQQSHGPDTACPYVS